MTNDPAAILAQNMSSLEGLVISGSFQASGLNSENESDTEPLSKTTKKNRAPPPRPPPPLETISGAMAIHIAKLHG